MKNKYAVIIFLVGSMLAVIGALFKMMHWPYANTALLSAMSLQVLGGFIFIIKLFFTEKGKDFLKS
ncbi:MAG: gliding motility protein GldL [Bacteroidetes bacterium]|nr:gliding motility protein GldL [Bacteroidota bacterium]